MKTNTGLSWFYYNPFFGHDKILADGNTGIIESGVNLALWGAVAGGIAKALGSPHAMRWGVGTFAVLIAAEYLFNASASTHGASIGGHTNGDGAPTTAATPTGSPQQFANFSESENAGFGETENSGFGGQ